MRVTSRELRAFLECPAYYHFTDFSLPSPVNKQFSIIQSVIQKCCLQATETGWKANWRRVVDWVDKRVFCDVDVHQSDQFAAARLVAEHCLRALDRWYRSYYKDMAHMAYVDLDLLGELQGEYFIEARAPLVHLTDPLSISVLQDIDVTERKMYNNLEIRALAWLLDQELDCGQIDVNGLCIGKEGGLQIKQFSIPKSAHKRTESVVLQIVKSIGAGIRYPSRTEKCDSCPYLRRCSL